MGNSIAAMSWQLRGSKVGYTLRRPIPAGFGQAALGGLKGFAPGVQVELTPRIPLPPPPAAASMITGKPILRAKGRAVVIRVLRKEPSPEVGAASRGLDFKRALAKTLAKNAELYRRLAAA